MRVSLTCHVSNGTSHDSVCSVVDELWTSGGLFVDSVEQTSRHGDGAVSCHLCSESFRQFVENLRKVTEKHANG